MKRLLLVIFLATLSASVSPYQELPVLVSGALDLRGVELQKFQEHTLSRLPSYERHFKKYSDLYRIPWTLLAAVAYQESKWDEKAVSHTGVRGLMQLTEQTAEHVGVEDREDPLQSIRGGAFYLRYLYEKTNSRLNSHQRWAQALSAYNIGWGHLRDAYKLSIRLNKNPNNWSEFKKVLPKLEQSEYYSQLNYGYARGNETVAFVDKVFKYYRVLNRTFRIQSYIAGI